MQPQNPNAQAEVKVRVPLNPFPHYIAGIKNLLKTSLTTLLLSLLFSAVLLFLVEFASALIMGSAFLSISSLTSRSGLFTFLAKMIAVLVIATLVSGVGYSVVARVIITGSRNEKIGFNNALSVALRRYIYVALSFLLVMGIVLAVYLVAIASAFLKVPALTILLTIAALVFVIIFSLRMSYILYIAVDDEKPSGVMSILKGSAALWKVSGGALFVYGLTTLVVAIVLSALTGGGQNSSAINSTSYGSPSTFDYATGIFSALIGTLVVVLIYAGVGHIYNAAKNIKNGAFGQSTPQTPIAAPVSPAQPVPPAV